MQMILRGHLPIADIVNVKIIDLAEAPDAYRMIETGAPEKFVIDPTASCHGRISNSLLLFALRSMRLNWGPLAVSKPCACLAFTLDGNVEEEKLSRIS
jgi:hypothetical protein